MIRTVGLFNTDKPHGGIPKAFVKSHFAGAISGDDFFDSQGHMPPWMYEESKAHALGVLMVAKVLQQTSNSFKSLGPEGDYLKALLQCISGIAAHTVTLENKIASPAERLKEALSLYSLQVSPALQKIFREAHEKGLFQKYSADTNLWQSSLVQLALGTAAEIYTSVDQKVRQSFATQLFRNEYSSHAQTGNSLDDALSPNQEKYRAIIAAYLSNAKALLNP